MCKCGYTYTPHHSSLCSSLPVCRWCPASEETLISDRLLGTGAKLKLKPTCDEWQRLLPLAKGHDAQDDRGRGDESGDIAPARLHQTCIRTTSPLTPVAPLPALAGPNPARNTYESIGYVPAQHGILGFLDIPRPCCPRRRPGRPPTSRLYRRKRQFYVTGLHSIAVALPAHTHLPIFKGRNSDTIKHHIFVVLPLVLPAHPVSLTSANLCSSLIQCLPLNFQWLFHPSPSIQHPLRRVYEPAPCTPCLPKAPLLIH